MKSAKLDADDPAMMSLRLSAPATGYPERTSQDPARALRRRRKIPEDAKENGVSPLEPTPEMIQNAQREDGTSEPRPLKRNAGDGFDSSLSSMPEEIERRGWVAKKQANQNEG